MSRTEHWEKIYKEKSPLEVSWYQNKPSVSLSIINTLPISKNDDLIDVGFGISQILPIVTQLYYDETDEHQETAKFQ